VIGWPVRGDAESELGSIFLNIAYFQLRMATYGFFLRGAIALGDAYVDDVVVLGSAFLEIAKGKSKETMTNFFDMKSRYATEYVDGVIAKIKRTLKTEENSKVTSRAPEVPRGPLHEPVPRIKSVKHQRRQLCPVYRYHGT
jgi:hypothetical protein